jgi:predicted outer membrane repeat protein
MSYTEVSSNTAMHGGGFDASGNSTTLDHVQIHDNVAGGDGGGFDSSSTLLTVTHSTIANNDAGNVGGGFYMDGSVFYIESTDMLSNTANSYGGVSYVAYAGGVFSDVLFMNNSSALDGGALYPEGELITIQRSSFINNHATGNGGAFAVAQDSVFTVTDDVTFTGNTAGGLGGAIHVEAGDNAVILSDATFQGNAAANGGAIASLGRFTVTNATIAGNAASSTGGGLVLAGTARLVNVTVFSNSAPTAAGVYYSNTAGPIQLVNTILAGPAADVCAAEAGIGAVQNTSSIATDADCGLRTVTSIGLGTLGNYGGALSTVPLLPGSPALDAASAADCPATDQRGVSRVGTCDIGAFESRGFGLSIVSGSPQTTTIGTNFAAPLVVAYTSANSEPVGPGGLITLTAPNSGAGIAPRAVVTGVADATGRVTTTLAANNTVGSYAVTISAVSAGTPLTANFTNNPVPTPTPTPTPGGPTPTPTRTPTPGGPTPTPTRTPTPGGPTPTPGGPTPTSTPSSFDAFVSPSHGAVTTSTVFIIGPTGSGFTGATGVFVKGVKMFHVVRNDRRVEFTMKQSVAVAGTTVDVVLVKAGGAVMTFTKSYNFEGPTSASGSTSTGAVLTTTSGVTITVPPQGASLRPDAADVAQSLVITYAPVDAPAELPGDVPLSFFKVAVGIAGRSVPTLTNPLTMALPVDTSKVPAGQRPWLYEWTDGGRWSVVPNQTYDPATGLVTAPTKRLGTYALTTALLRRNYFPRIGRP